MRWTYGVNLNNLQFILLFDGEEQLLEPLQAAKVSTNPEKVDLLQTHFLGVTRAHPIPYRLQDAGEGSDADTRADKDGRFEFEDILRGGSERAVNVDSWQDLVDIVWNAARGHGDDFGATFVGIGVLRFCVKITSQAPCKCFGEVANSPYMDRNIIFLRGRC